MHFDESSMFAGHKMEAKTLKVSWDEQIWVSFSMIKRLVLWRDRLFLQVFLMIWLDAYRFSAVQLFLYQLCM